MPIYAYKCDACGHRQDVLQKVSDPALTRCPACGAERFAKQVTAAGFQLKGSGWYATDFRGGTQPAAAEGDPGAQGAKGDKGGDKGEKAAGAGADAGSTASPAPASPSNRPDTASTDSA